MPLVQTTLQSFLQRIIRKPPTKVTKVVDAYVDVYLRYAQQATAGGVPPVFSGLEKTAMKGALLPAMLNPVSGSATTLAQAWDNAIGAFWLAQIPPQAVFPGSTLIAYIPSTLFPTLLALFANTNNTALAVASGMASAIHLTTTTAVRVTFPGPAEFPLV